VTYGFQIAMPQPGPDRMASLARRSPCEGGVPGWSCPGAEMAADMNAITSGVSMARNDSPSRSVTSSAGSQ